MIEDYADRMGAPSHIREIGPHPHRWVLAHTDSRGKYEHCAECGTRRFVGFTGQDPVRPDWIGGASWERERKAAPDVAEQESAAEPTEEPERRKPGPKPGSRRDKRE